ncbi:MAG: coproporphyrinogen oxidase, partial [Rhodospirillales bacterium]|nr:coproporphyrinogen oxidase [Rhodospirillales bacterium]
RWAEMTPGRTVTSIFFGGGTPTLMKPTTMQAILDAIARAWSVADDVEITAEANPSSAEIETFRAFRSAGVNRLSLGVQSFDPAALKFLGRRHDADQALRAIHESQKIFTRTSFDLIYARPDQTRDIWRAELDRALSLAAEHLSVYQLTIEPGTEFRRRKIQPAPEGPAAEMYELTHEMMSAAGLPAYEISNHARPGAECRHNLVYWRGDDYAGIGPGAHGRIREGGVTFAIEEIRAPAAWLAATHLAGATQARTALSPGERLDELVFMGLRLAEGIPEDRFVAQTGRTFDDVFAPAKIAALVAEGYVERTNAALRATQAGAQRLNSVISYLLT